MESYPLINQLATLKATEEAELGDVSKVVLVLKYCSMNTYRGEEEWTHSYLMLMLDGTE
jgi:hypothetical protein